MEDVDCLRELGHINDPKLPGFLNSNLAHIRTDGIHRFPVERIRTTLHRNNSRPATAFASSGNSRMRFLESPMKTAALIMLGIVYSYGYIINERSESRPPQESFQYLFWETAAYRRNTGADGFAVMTGPGSLFRPGLDQHRINTFLDQDLPRIRLVAVNRMPPPAAKFRKP